VSESIRVLIADDHEMVRRGLATFLALSDEVEVVGQAASGAEAVRLCADLRPEVVLMDLMMPDLDGVSAIRAIKGVVPDTQIIALTSFHDDQLVLSALQAGAISYLLKDISATGLADAIRAARAGRSTLSPQASQVIVKLSTGAPPTRRGQDLSQRELEVLRLMVGGLTNSQIAQRLVVSRSTVNFHVSSILGKLGVQSRTEAVVVALHDQLVV
jgi:NarL family two-component system response regulator LiaR